jgi:glutamate-1-semialdehyde 2,1-aminomutase
MTRVSASLAERARRVMPGGVSSPVRALGAVGDDPLFIDRGHGAYVLDADGASLIDYIGSWGAAILGHGHPSVVEAVARAIHDGLGFGATTRLEVELAEVIVERVPGIEQVRFVCSGTEAVMSAIRLARAATRRSLVVKFEGCYHGHSDALLTGAGSGLATLGIASSPGVTEGAARDTMTLPYNDTARVEELFAELGDRVACVLVEPIAGNMGVVPATAAFLASLRALTTAHGALLVFDEVMTGFRVARGGAQELTGITADLVTLGKILGGGLPVAAYAGPAALMQRVAPLGPVYQAGTLAGNPIGMAAGLATLRLLDASAYAKLEWSGERLEVGLRAVLDVANERACVQRVGSMLTVFFGIQREVRDYGDAARTDHRRFADFFRRMRRGGVLLPPSGFESWFLSLAHGSAAIDATLEVLTNVDWGPTPSRYGDDQNISPTVSGKK